MSQFQIGDTVETIDDVIKEELGYLFRKYDNVKFYDADYQKYGLGATEVYIFQNF